MVDNQDDRINTDSPQFKKAMAKFMDRISTAKYCYECKSTWMMNNQCPKCKSKNVYPNPYANKQYIEQRTLALKGSS